MSRLKFSLIGLCCSLFLVGQLASAQVLDDPTKKDPGTQTKTEPPKTEPPKTEPTKTDDKARIIDQAPQTKTVGLNTPVTAEPIKKDVVAAGPFAGLEVFGYNYFAAARETVALKAKLKSENLTLKDKESISAVDKLVTPNQITFQDIALPAPDRYQLGPGDKLIIRYSSPTLEVQDKAVTVDALGNLFVPVTGTKLVVRGMTLLQVQSALEKEMARAIRNVTVTATLSELRTMSVSIVGEITLPGNYQFPSVITLFNALLSAGGPTFRGSIRNIEVRRSNSKAIQIDLYKYLLNGDASQDIPLQPGDLILIPPMNKMVGARGAVNREMVFELKNDERLSDLLKMAGGAQADALLERVEVSSVQQDVERQLLNYNLSKGENPILKNGDVLKVYTLRPDNQNTITVEGAVDQPRAYPFTKGMTVATALDLARGLLREAYLERADLVRENPDKTISLIPINLQKALRREPSDDLPLQRYDRIRIYGEAEVKWLDSRFVEIKGAVRQPGRFTRMDNMRLSDLVLQSGGLLPDASFEKIFIFRKNNDGSEGPLLKVDGGKALFQNDVNNVILQDRDTIVVYKKSEAQFIEEKVITVKGAVLKPGSYPRSENMTALDAVELAGGFLPTASLSNVYILRKNPDGTEGPFLRLNGEQLRSAGSTENLQLQDKDTVLIYTKDEANYRENAAFTIEGAILKPGSYTKSQNLTLKDAIEVAGGYLPTASVDTVYIFRKNPDGTEGPLVKVNGATLLSNGGASIEIQNRDQVVVYRKDEVKFQPKQSVTIFGSVLKPGTFPKSTGLTLRDVLSIAGGVKPGASDKILVSHARIQAGTPNEIYKLSDVLAGKVNYAMQDGDIVSVPSDSDFQETAQFVVLDGQVKNPGTYPITRRGETIKDLIERAGGLTNDAWAEGAAFVRNPKLLVTDSYTRLSPRIQAAIKEVQDRQYERALAKSDLDKARALASTQQAGATSGSLSIAALNPNTAVQAAALDKGPNPLVAQQLGLRETVSPARVVSATDFGGNLPVRLDSALRNKNSADNLILRDGDVINIPLKPVTVGVAGAVLLPSNQLYASGKTLKYYLDRSGGFTTDADINQVFIIRPTGNVTRAKSSTMIQLGDTIFVPTKVMVTNLTDGTATFEKIVQQITSGAIFFSLFNNLIK
jgi:protein involved in polysaccharide export with SLBB domain